MILRKTFLVFAFGFVVFSAEAAGTKLLAKVVDETLELAAKRSGRTLGEGTKIALSREMLKNSARYGDDVLPLVRNGGLEVLEQGIRHGDDFWRLCKAVPEASRSLALHSEQLLPLAKKMGPDILKIEARAPGLSVRFAEEFGESCVHYIARHSPEEAPRLLGYMAKADSPATKKLFAETVVKSKDPSAFLQALNWKNIMAGGLTTAAIVSAYKVSDGLQEGLKNPEAAEHVTNTALAPFRYGLYLLFAILLIPVVVKSIIRGIAIWKKSK